MSPLNFHNAIVAKAEELNFSAVGVIPLPLLEWELEQLNRAIELNYTASLTYLERNHHLRRDPSLFLTGAKSAVVTLTSYKPDSSYSSREVGIASYALGKDYHIVVKEALHKLGQFITEEGGSYRPFTDSAPLFERALAVKAGLGFIGKSGMLINRHFGLHTFIGVIITDRELHYPDYSGSDKSYCGSCSRCIDGCPTSALVTPYKLDARRCISYRTIESRELLGENKELPHESYFFGCDICIELCPWSKRGSSSKIEQFKPLKVADGVTVDQLSREEWLAMDEGQFNRVFKESPLFRRGLEKIKSNIRYETTDGG